MWHCGQASGEPFAKRSLPRDGAEVALYAVQSDKRLMALVTQTIALTDQLATDLDRKASKIIKDAVAPIVALHQFASSHLV